MSKRNYEQLYLENENRRWKWMTKATAATAAATAAGVTAAHAGLVTVDLSNNYISSGGNHLNADLTGDGHPDVTIANAFYSSYLYVRRFASVSLNGVQAFTRLVHDGPEIVAMRIGSQFGTYYAGSVSTGFHGTGPRSLTGSIPILFKDLRINGGALTKGSLEVTVRVDDGVNLDSFSYNTNTPDQGSTLALLALGAGGLLALRKWRGAQAKTTKGIKLTY